MIASEDVATVNAWPRQALHAFNEIHLGPYTNTPIGVLAKMGDQVIGGIYGGVLLGWLAVEQVFLDEQYRGQGLGRQMMNAIEAEAKRLGARRAFVDTASFQAEGFYAKCGYQVWGRFTDFAPGVDRIYMRKDDLGV